MRNQLDKIIITAMDRFVWFVLLVVMSHLVTEFTRVTGYARGNRHDVVLINDTLLQPMPVANMIFYPDQDYGLYEPASYYNANANTNNNVQSNSAVMMRPSNGESNSGLTFSFRPIIDSIFEIPISTLRAVNNLVARLTGSYQHQTPMGPLKSMDAVGMVRSLQTSMSDGGSAPLLGAAAAAATSTSTASATTPRAAALPTATQGKTVTVRKPTLPEVSA